MNYNEIEEMVDNENNLNDLSNEKDDLCIICFNDLIEKIYYKIEEDDEWITDMNVCENCIKYLLETLWETFKKNMESDCVATLRRLLKNGPPINLPYDEIFKDLTNKSEYKIKKEFLCFKNSITNNVFSAKLVNSVVGEEREKLISQYKKFLSILENKEILKLMNESKNELMNE